MSSKPRFASVVLDVDSTVSGIEGVDWLAGLRGREVAERCAELTRQAMEGTIGLEEVYGARLEAIAPTGSEVERLGDAYITSVAPGCAEAVSAIRTAGTRVVLVSGGLREAILPLAVELGFTEGDVHAVSVRFDDGGSYRGFDELSPLTRSDGKPKLVASLNLPRPILAVGDGITDLAMRAAADSFAAFTGFVERPNVVGAADWTVPDFASVIALVLPDHGR